MNLDEPITSTASLKHKLKQTLCFSSCSSPPNRRRPLNSPLSSSSSSSSSSSDNSNPAKVSSIWIRTCRDHDFHEIRDKCRNVFNRIGNHHHHHHRRYSSADFRYDPLSYALNFEDGSYNDDSLVDEARLRNFSSRLPASPALNPVAVSR